MATYQHVMPGMGAAAVYEFATELSTQREIPRGYRQRTSPGAPGRRLPTRIHKGPGTRITTRASGRSTR